MKRSLGSLVGLLTLMVACGSVAPPATPITGADGAWSNPATWGGKLPDANSSVTIPAGKTVTVDSSVSVRSITVNGTLLWSDGDSLELKANWVMVESGGAFKIGSADKPFLKRATVTLTGSNVNENIMEMGTKCLCAMGGGQLQIYGEDRLSWTKLSASAAVGETKLALLEAGGWRAGEKIVIASSSFNPEEAETANIKSVSSDGKTLTLETGLKYAHYGQLQTFDGKSLDERAEIGLLSRNIVIQGDDASSALKFGGHVMVMSNGSAAKIRGVEFKRMGQFNRLGRYPLHFHQMRDASGSFVAASSIHDTIQRGIVVHGSDNLRVERNVVYNTVGHAYSVEDGSERGTVFNANLGLLPRASSFTNEGLKDQDDQGAATFWLRTAAVTLTGNASAGGAFSGYWFDMGFVDGNNATKALLTFQNNTVHSHGGTRIPGTERDTWAIWHTDGTVPSQEGALYFDGVTAYKNARAIETLGRGVTRNSVLADNAITLSGGTLRDSLVVSRSANTDTLREWGETGMFAYGGYANAERVTWVGFKDGRVISRTNTCFVEFPRFSNTGAKLIDSDPAVGCGDIILSDLDGSISKSGQPSKLVSSDSGLGLVSSACQKLLVNGVSVCPNYDYRTLNVQYPTGPNAQFANDAWRIDVVRDEDGDRVTPKHFRWASYVIPEKTYHLEVKSTNATDTGVYNLAKLGFVNIGLTVGDHVNAELLPGGHDSYYDPAAATHSVSLWVAAPAGTYRIRRCEYRATCGNDPTKWPVVAAAASLSGLQAQTSSGYFADASKLSFKFFGGDQLRFERL